MAEHEIIIEVKNLKKYYPVRAKRANIFSRSKSKQAGILKAVDGITFIIERGKALGMAGESGCGKSTIGRMLLKLIEATDGEYFFNNVDVTNIKTKEDIKKFRKSAQLMFQNPYEAINPRFTIYRALLEPLLNHNIGNTKDERISIIKEILEKVNLKPVEMYMEKYPHQMSGGQLQRVVLARALIINPIFLVADEPVSMLDVSIRAGVLNLMKDINRKMNLTTLYISHDLSLIQYMCDETVIIYLGNIVEKGTTKNVLANPLHPYTKALIAAMPSMNPGEKAKELKINNSIAGPINLPQGCIFQRRCPYVSEKCKEKAPEMRKIEDNHFAACYRITLTENLRGPLEKRA